MENIAIIIVLLCGKGITHFRKGTGHAGLPPMITSEFEPEYFFPAAHSTSLTLQCQAENGNITYEWYKNFMKLEDNQRVTYDWDTGEIIFTNLSNEDFGMYYCLAKNEFGASISAFFNISEPRIDSFPIFKERDHTCQEFHYCKLSCSDKPFCVPRNNCRIEWKIGPGTSNNVDIKENMELDREGNLHFLNINQSYGAKNYYCGVWNENERIFRKGNLLNLDVKDSADSFVPPRAVYQSGYKAFVGENATLQCIFSGNPIPKVTWQTRNGSHIVENHKYSIRKSGRELQIRNTTFKDDEVYKCVSNGIIQNPYLNVTSLPLFRSVHKRFMMKIVKFTISKNKELLCDAISAPDELEPVVIMWMKNGKELNQGSIIEPMISLKESAYELSNDKKKLHIYKTDVDDAGCYTCVIENSEGIAVANFLLHVQAVDHTSRRHLTIEVLPILCTVGAFLLIASVIITKKIRRITENKRLQVERGGNRGSGATVYVYSEPNPENQAHVQVESINDLNTGSEREVWPEVVDAENIYDILGDCPAMVTDASELSCYDCMENIHGIYNMSFRANEQTFKEALNGHDTLAYREGVEISGKSFSMRTNGNISKSSTLDEFKGFHETNNTNFIEQGVFDDESNDTIEEIDTSESNDKLDDTVDRIEGTSIGVVHVTISSHNSNSNSCNC